MPDIDPEIEFPKVEKLMHKLAWSYANRYRIPVEECLRECHWAYAKAATRYGKNVGENDTWVGERKKVSSFSSLVYSMANFALIDLVKERANTPLMESLTPTPVEYDNKFDAYFGQKEPACVDFIAPTTHSPTMELICDLSEDAKEIISLLLDTPTEIIRGQRVTAKKLLKLVVAHLAWEHGPHSGRRLDQAVNEIRERFQSAWAEERA